MDAFNFNEHIVSMPFNEFSGSEKKRTIILDDGNKYMLKFPDPIREKGRAISYINNAVSEYIGCQIFKSAGFEAQDTILGEFTDERGIAKTACACKDMNTRTIKLIETEKICLEYLDDIESITFNSIRKIISDMGEYVSETAFQEYCRRFIIDALIGNPDRHNGNWGFLNNVETQEMKIAPVYDCGSSLSPLYSDDELLEKPHLYNVLAMNVASAIRKEDGGKIHYNTYLLSNENNDINIALKEVVPKIDLSKIKRIINEIPYISDIRKNFYIALLTERYERVLLPSLEQALEIGISKKEISMDAPILHSIYDSYIAPLTSFPQEGQVTFSTIGGKQVCDYIKNNNIFFLMDEDKKCFGVIHLDKSNRNIKNFIRFAAQAGIRIDVPTKGIQKDNN